MRRKTKRDTLIGFTVPMLLLTATIAHVPSAVNSATLEVPIPSLIGTYDDGVQPVDAVFNVTIDPAAILSASVRIRGDLPWPSYTTSCGYNGVIFSLDMPATTGVWETKVYVNQRVGFEVYAPLAATGGATWDFLSAGEGSVTFIGVGRPLPDGCSYIHGGCCPMAQVFYAAIVFEYDEATPVEISTWGRIKALYR